MFLRKCHANRNIPVCRSSSQLSSDLLVNNISVPDSPGSPRDPAGPCSPLWPGGP